MRATALLVAVLLPAAAGLGCGEEDEFAGSPDPRTERSDRPAKPPPGWRTFANRRAGFTLAVPPDWSARARKTATLIRSSDRVLVVTVAADRSEPGRTTAPREYVRRAFRSIPGFRALKPKATRPVTRSPYPSARVDGTGVLEERRQRQRITVAAFRRPRRVTYSVIAFSAAAEGAPAHARELALLLASLRARRPVL